LALVLMALGSAVWFIPPMIARFLFETDILNSGIDKPAESAYAFIAMKLLPNGLLGMLIAAMFAATMSSMDTGLNSQVGAIVRNIIPRLRSAFGRTEALTQKVEMRICHIATVFLGTLITCYALLFVFYSKITLFDASLTVASVIGVPMSFPMFLGLWLKKLPKWSYFPIFFACLAPSFWSFIDGKFYDNPWTVQERAIWIMLFGTLAAIICLIFSKRTSEQSRKEVDAFFENMHTPIDYKTEIGDAEVDYEQYFVISKAVCTVGALILLILLVPNDTFNRLCILFVAGFVLTIGVLLRIGGQRMKTKSLAAAVKH